MNEFAGKPIAWKPLKSSGRIGTKTQIHLVSFAGGNLMGDLYTACGLSVPSDLLALRDWQPEGPQYCEKCRKVVATAVVRKLEGGKLWS